jgi:hypothetical protein
VDEYHNVKFDIRGCILLVLIIKAGSGSYPEFDTSAVPSLVGDTSTSGWTAGYSKLGVKYSRTLKQSVPQRSSADRGSSVDNDKLMYDESITDRIQRLKRKRESEHQS